MKHVVPCSPERSQWLADYLRATNAKILADPLATGRLRASCMTVDRANLGSLHTIFVNLGKLRAPDVTNAETFVVKEIRQILSRSDCDAENDRFMVEALIM